MSSIAIHILSFICYFHVYSIIISNLSSMLVVFYVIRLTCYLIWFVILTYNHAVLVLILFFSLEIFLYLLFPCHLLSKLLLVWMFLLRFRSRNNYELFFHSESSSPWPCRLRSPAMPVSQCPASAYPALYPVCDEPVRADILLVLLRSHTDFLTLFPSHWVAVCFLFRSEAPSYAACGPTGAREMREPTAVASSSLRPLGFGLLLPGC